MRFLADMNVAYTVVQFLRAAGHDVAHLRDLSAGSAPELHVFALARAERRILLTLDLDLPKATGHGLPAIVALRLNDPRPSRVAERLTTALGESSNALASGATVVVDDEGMRLRCISQSGPSG